MKKKKNLFLIILCFISLFGFKGKIKADGCDVNVVDIMSTSVTALWKCSGSGAYSLDSIGIYKSDSSCTVNEKNKIETDDKDNILMGFFQHGNGGSTDGKKKFKKNITAGTYYIVSYKIHDGTHPYICLKTAEENSSEPGKIINFKVPEEKKNDNSNKHSLNVELNKDNVNEKNKTVTGTTVAQSRKIETGAFCDDKLKALIHKYWNYIMLLAPVLLIALLTIDGIKCVSSGTADKIKKYSNDAVKRVIATLILLALPSLISMIMNMLGLGSKICF